MSSISPLATITTRATALSNIVAVVPQAVIGYQAQNGFTTNPKISGNYLTAGLGIKGPTLLFHYEGEQSVVLESDITDHYIENNSAIQDQIAIKPEIITTHGFIGELNNVAPYANTILSSLQSALTAISPYTPELTVNAQIAYNEAFQAYQIAANAVRAGVSAWATINPAGKTLAVIGNSGLIAADALTQNKQQQMFQQFYGYWASKTLFTVQTPWAVFQNMAIVRLRAIQEADTNTISDFEVSFKRLKQASILIQSNAASDKIQNDPTFGQSQSPVSNTSTPGPASIPFSGVNSLLGNFV